MTDSEVTSITSKLKDLNETQALLVLYRVLIQCSRFNIPYSRILLSIIRAYTNDNIEG